MPPASGARTNWSSAFIVGVGTSITYRANVWHHPMAALNRGAQFAIPMWRRLCITCCSPFPTFTSRRGIRRDLVYATSYAASATGSLYRSPRAIIAQTIRAILLASAMAATLTGRRTNNAVSQGRCLVPWILA